MTNYNDYKGSVTVSIIDKNAANIEFTTLPSGWVQSENTIKATYNKTGYTVNASAFTVKDAITNAVLTGTPVVSVNAPITNAGDYVITVNYEDETHKAVKTFNMTVEPKQITASGLVASNKAYDSTNKAQIGGGTLNGVIDGDDVSANWPTEGTFASVDAGNNIDVAIPAIELQGAAKANYTLVQPTGIKANITPAPIAVTAVAAQKRVGTSDPVLTYTYTGTLYNSDAFTGELTRKQGEAIGTYDILQGTLALNANYSITFNKATFEIVDKTPQTIVVDTISAKTYGDDTFVVNVTPDSTSGLNTFTYESSNTDVAEISANGTVTIKAAGKTNITVKQAGNADYAEFTRTQELVVNKVNIAVTADAKTKRVGTADPALTYQYTGTLVGTDAFTGELTRAQGEEIGTYDILQGTLALNDNYAITYNKATFEILDKTPQTITVADIPAKTYGDSTFALEVTPDATSGLNTFTYASSNESVATVDATGNVTIVGAGEAAISVSQAGNDDYAAATVTKNLVVNKKALEIKVDDITITYGDAINTNITYEGFVNAEDKTVLTKDVTVSGYSAKPNAGTYDITLGGAEAANYEISYVNATLTVNKKDASITQLKVYDKLADTTTAATINASTLVVDGVIFGDDVSVNLETAAAAFASAEVGADIAVNITNLSLVGAHAENYNLTSNTFATTASIKAAITAGDIAAQITAIPVIKDATEITLPNVPEGYTVTLKSSDNEAVVNTDKSVSPVENDTTVGLVLTITNNNDETDTADTSVINVTIPASTKINVTVTAEANGTATGSGVYLKNSDVTVVATPDSGYKFSGWYNQEASVSSNTSYTFKAENDVALVAKFAKQSSSRGGSSSYLVKFETNGAAAISSQSVARNSLVKEPEAPVKEGFTFEGWYTDKELTTAYDFATKVTKSFTLYAKWTENEKEEETTETTLSFIDVKSGDWFYENVKYVVENNLMNGVTEIEFAPNTPVTRAMLVTVLYRNEGEPATNRSIPFADVDMGSYYANAVSWAKQNNIVTGISENEFAPNVNITREQIAAIMFRYATYKGMDAVTLEENLHFEDAAQISEYAISAMNWAVGSGLINGKTTTTLNPQDNATRAEIAAILQRFIEANN